MAYKSKKKQLAYMKRWRRKHPNYMRTYYRIAVKPFSKTDRVVRANRVSDEVEV